MIDLSDADVDRILADLTCRACGSIDGVEMESSRTQYHFDGEDGSDDDPNRDVPLCREHAKEHHEHWDSMWADYWASCG